MTASFVIQPNDTVAVSFPDLQPYVNVEVQQPTPWGVVSLQGPQGPPGSTGPAGPAYSSPAWFFGNGAPTTIIGSKPSDLYMDLLTGTIYRLGD